MQHKDLESVEKRIDKVTKVAKTGNQQSQKELALLCRVQDYLQQSGNIRNMDLQEEEKEEVKSWQLLTMKPVVYVANVDESTLKQQTNTHVECLKKILQKEHVTPLLICANLEAEVADMIPSDRNMLLHEYGLMASGLEKLIQTSYQYLDLITYFTAGVQELRAWTIKKGMRAPQAASLIHSDFEKGFIKAEIIKLQDYQEYKTETACLAAGKVKTEGKEYIVQDGDIIHFRINK